MALAASLRDEAGSEEGAVSTALRDLWGGVSVLQAAPGAVMMVVTYAEHQALAARQTTPRPRPRRLPRNPKGDDVGCWHCGITGHVRRDCRKRLAEEAARSGAPPGGGGASSGAGGGMGDGGGGGSDGDEAAYAVRETCHLVLVATGGEAPSLAGPAGDVILDIGATATVAGAAWVAAYLALLSPVDQARVLSTRGLAVFTFGGGASQRAVERLEFPVRVGGARCLLSVGVVAGSLPLLLSRRSLASLGTVLGVAAGRLTVSALDVTVFLALSAAGHLTFNAVTGQGRVLGASEPAPIRAVALVAVLAAVLDKDSAGLDRAVRKLHTQYGHCSAARLIGLLRDQGVTDAEVFRAVTAETTACDACRRDGPRPPHPLVAIPKSLPFSDTVAVDLAFLPPLGLFLDMVDLGTRFSKAVALANKETATVTWALLFGWLSNHGAPRAILADSGAEFDSSLFLSLAERFNVATLSTAAQSHHSNGVVERHNAVLNTMVRRLRSDYPSAPLQELLDAACLAKNSMSVHNGASPFQLMSGSVPRLPAALTDGLPALGAGRVAGDDALRTTLSLLPAARVAHTQAEADVSRRRALVRNATNVPPRAWAVGDVVYYWSEGVSFSPGAWRGPAHVTEVAVAKDAVRLQHGNR